MAQIISQYGTMIAHALGQTLLVTLLSFFFAFVIGVVFGVMNVSSSKVLNIIGNVYVDVIRGVPLIVLTFFIYFGIPAGMQSIGATSFRISVFVAGVIALSMNAGAYMAEIFRGGIKSVDKGQMEASRSLGVGYGKTMLKIILPQAIRTMIPSIINQFIISLKDTSILSVIGFPELTKAGNIIVGNTFQALQVWGIIGIIYAVVIIALSRIAKYIERRITGGEK